MARTPTNFFTSERKNVLEALTGPLSSVDEQLLLEIGRRSAQKLWPIEIYDAINNPVDHSAFKQAIEPLIDPEQLGFRGCFLPEEAGGAGISVPAYMMGLEMIAQGNGSIALSLLIDGSVLNSIWKLGDDKQKEMYVINARMNKEMTAFALTEPGHGSDAGNLETRASLNEGHWVINGRKIWNTNGGWAKYYYVMARTNPNAELASRGVSIIMVHEDEITSFKQTGKYGTPGSFNAELLFDNVRVPVEDNGVRRMIGVQDRGFSDAKQLLTGGRVTVAAYLLGVATEAFEDGIDYAQERTSRGIPLFEHQAMQLPFGDLIAYLHAGRLLTYLAARRMQEGNLGTEAAQAKLVADQWCERAVLWNMHVHGGMGTSKEFRANQLFQDWYAGHVGEGTPEVLRGIITKELRR